MAETSSVYATLSFNVFVFVALMIAFEFLRTRELDVYSPRSRGTNPSAPKVKQGLFRWILQVYNIDDNEMRELAGMDGYVLLRFLLFCTKVCILCSIGSIVLLPVYATAPGMWKSSNMDTLTMAAIEFNGTRLWACLLFEYLFTFIFLALIHKEYENFTYARIKYFGLSDRNIPLQVKYSIKVENLPLEYRSSQKLREFFEAVFPSEVVFAHVSVSVPELDRVITERNEVRDALEQVEAAYYSSGCKNRPQLMLTSTSSSSSSKYYCCCSRCNNDNTTVDKIEYLTKKLEDLCNIVETLKSSAITDMTEIDNKHVNDKGDKVVVVQRGQGVKKKKGHHANILNQGLTQVVAATEASIRVLHDIKDNILSRVVSATGFVTFSTRRAQVSASQVPIISHQFPGIITGDAPQPTDIIWNNLTVSTEYTEHICYATSAALCTGLFFWAVTLAFVAALADLNSLESYFPFVKSLNATDKSILQGILPVLALLVLSIVLVFIIYFIVTNIEKRKTYSEVQYTVFQWYFAYQLANVYILLLAGSIYTSLENLLADPAGIINCISSSLPTVSVFFINFIITTWLSGVPLVLIRIYPSLVLEFYKFCYPSNRITRSMLKGGLFTPLSPLSLDYGSVLPNFLYILCIVMLNWVIAPIIVIFAACFFGSSYIAYKYMYTFVIVRAFESGGLFWYGLYKYSMIGLLVANLAMIGYMGIKQGIKQSPLMAPLPFIILYCWRYTEQKFLSLSSNIPYDIAVREDSDSSEEVGSFDEGLYKQPSIVESSIVHPYPHRINNIPLLDPNGSIDDIYVDNIPEGVDPVQYINSLSYQAPTAAVPTVKKKISIDPGCCSVDDDKKVGETVSILHIKRTDYGSGSDDDCSSVINLI